MRRRVTKSVEDEAAADEVLIEAVAADEVLMEAAAAADDAAKPTIVAAEAKEKEQVEDKEEEQQVEDKEEEQQVEEEDDDDEQQVEDEEEEEPKVSSNIVVKIEGDNITSMRIRVPSPQYRHHKKRRSCDTRVFHTMTLCFVGTFTLALAWGLSVVIAATSICKR